MNKKDSIRQEIFDEINDTSLTVSEDERRAAREAWDKDTMFRRDFTIDWCLKNPKYHNKDFYIVAMFSIDKLNGHPKKVVLPRFSCPTPVYNQTVWKYVRSANCLEYMWSIPGKIKYYWLLRTFPNVPKKYEYMAKFVHLMESGELLRWAKKESGDKPDAVIKENVGEQWKIIH